MTVETVSKGVKLCNGAEMVKSFFYLGDRLEASDGFEAAVEQELNG